ncbi:hypothetical protein JXO59_10165 [candidate division KSB1 bacterium]|nr:hypothetical protein [candidate division KSB1 bacterium]
MIGLVMLPLTAGLAQDGLAAGEAQLSRFVASLDSLRAHMTALTRQSDSLASQITDLKQRHDLNYFERKRLERLLGSAQINAEGREKNLIQQNIVAAAVAAQTRLLHQQYALAIDSLLGVADRLPQADVRNRQRLGGQIESYRLRQTQLQSSLERHFEGGGEAAVALDAGDLPDEIQAKAGYLRDREDKLRNRAGLLEARLKQVHQEITLRKKMTELLDDVRLFDQQDEAVAITSRTIDGAGGKEGTYTDLNAPRAGAMDVEIASPMERLLQTDVRSLSDEGVDAYILNLQTQRHTLLFQADSLARLADSYDQQVETLRHKIHQPE